MSSPLLPPLFVLAASVVLGLLGSLIATRRANREKALALTARHAELARERDAWRTQAEDLRINEARLLAEIQAGRDRHAGMEAATAVSASKHEDLLRELRETGQQLARAQAELEAERTAGPERLALVTAARAELTHQFKALANDILEENSKRFAAHNQAGIDQLLRPLGEKLGEFKQSVDGLQKDGIEGRSALRTQIDGLRTLNERLSVEAGSLVAALKGSSKTQGDWGEMLLERMLEDCGMRKGHEYLVQESYTREDGTRARPDVILRLPEDRHLVIDAKISLLDYNAYCACNDDASRAASLGKHIGSLRQHVRGLKKGDYQKIYELHSIDFVVMFVPIEPAYLLALAKDGRLWHEAWEKDVLLVSPGSLYPVLRTVAHLWRQEQQNRNVQDIVERGALLYDKLAAFAGDLVRVGAGLDVARDSWESAMKKLTTGRGNAIAQAEKLKALGIKQSKQMPREVLEALQDDLAHALVEETDGAGVTGELFD